MRIVRFFPFFLKVPIKDAMAICYLLILFSNLAYFNAFSVYNWHGSPFQLNCEHYLNENIDQKFILSPNNGSCDIPCLDY
jgi:hypothetical protein